MCCSVISSFFPPNFPQEHLMLMYTSDSCTFKLDDLLSHPIPKVYSRIYWVLDNMLNAAVKQPSCQNHLGRPRACCSRRQTHTHSPASLPGVAVWQHCQAHLPSSFIRGITRASESIPDQHGARGEKIKVAIWIRCSLGTLPFKNRAFRKNYKRNAYSIQKIWKIKSQRKRSNILEWIHTFLSVCGFFFNNTQNRYHTDLRQMIS